MYNFFENGEREVEKLKKIKPKKMAKISEF